MQNEASLRSRHRTLAASQKTSSYPPFGEGRVVASPNIDFLLIFALYNNQNIWNLLCCLTSFTWHYVKEMQTVYGHSLFFSFCKELCCMNLSKFIHYTTDRHLGNSQVWDIIKNAARNIIVDVFGESIYTFFVGYTLETDIHKYICVQLLQILRNGFSK